MANNPPAEVGDAVDASSIPGSGRSPGVGNGNPFQVQRNLMGSWHCKESDMTEHYPNTQRIRKVRTRPYIPDFLAV